MADVKKFLDQAGTSYLWSKIKASLDTKATVSSVEAISDKLGEIPESVSQSTFADWIAAVALAAGDASAVEALDGRVDALETTVDTATTGLKDRMTAAEEDISDNASAIATLNGSASTAGSVAKAVADAIADEVERADAAYADIAYEAKVDTLVGEDTSKSARTIASEEVAKIVANADASYDTLKEIADWILDHPTDAAEYNSRITALETKTAGISGTITGYVAEQLAALSSTYAGKAYEAKVNTAETNITNLQGLHAAGTHNGKATVAEEVTAGIEELDLDNTYYSKTLGAANATAIATLTGAATVNGSVAKAIADEVSRADGAYDAKGAAAEVLGTSADTAIANTVYGAKAYAASLGANYATAAQGAKADSALQSTDVIALTNAEIDTAIANATNV